MITLYASNSEFGFLVTDERTGKTIYGEICDGDKFEDLCELVPQSEKVHIVVGNTKDADMIRSKLSSIKVGLTSYIEEEGLDISEQLLYTVHKTQVTPNHKKDSILVGLGLFIFGSLLASVAMYVLVMSGTIQAREDLIERSIRDLGFVQEYATTNLNSLSLLHEVSFLYEGIEIQLFEVDIDQHFTIIFLSEEFGLTPIQMRSASDVRLQEGSSVTVDEKIHTLYTLTGKVVN